MDLSMIIYKIKYPIEYKMKRNITALKKFNNQVFYCF